MALSHADACPKTPHIEIKKYMILIKGQGKIKYRYLPVTVRIQVVNGRYKARDLIP